MPDDVVHLGTIVGTVVDIDKRIAQVNERLRTAKTGVSLDRRGGMLWLRATLPPKPGSIKVKSHQQRLSLGVKATPAGIQHAEQKAKLLGAELNLGKFDWTNWGNDCSQAETVKDWVERFEADYWNRRKKTQQSLTTWDTDYSVVLKRLPVEKSLTPELLLAAIAQTDPDSRNRKRTVMVLAKLAKFAGLDVDFSHLTGDYSPKRVSPRTLPSDALIQEIRDGIENEGWRFLVGAIACYGLRPHEVFHLDLSEFPIAQVIEGKTGARFTYPLYPEWAERWNLQEVKLPKIGEHCNAKLGTKIARWFYVHQLPFRAYDLRHCYARRCFEFGLPPDMAAGLMGHSVQTHIDVYRAWIDQATYRKAYDSLINRVDRPTPPE